LRRFDGVDSLDHVPPPPALSELSRSELEVVLVKQSEDISVLKQLVSELREEIARLEGLKGRPNIKPSGMDKGTDPAKSAAKEKRRGRGKVTPRVTIDEKIITTEVPPGSRFNLNSAVEVARSVESPAAYRHERTS